MTQTTPRDAAETSWLSFAVRLARENVAAGGGPFGALIVRDGQLVATGTNRVTLDSDPTAHAEVVAIREACRKLATFDLTGCELVSSCEPCPLCVSAALWARVDRVSYTADRYDAAKAGFDDLAFYDLFETPRAEWSVPVLAIETEDHTAPFDAWLAKDDRVAY
ncbi:nucleoside deaminase [Haloechinothrix halophila]|uniref:nucleoside deaminase n=1 Tax=Haloechinothrix halophila TaxID=1069073 RepID=UPI000412623F|nr:nucleoside deaminase [Haloechinothrix halophila]